MRVGRNAFVSRRETSRPWLPELELVETRSDENVRLFADWLDKVISAPSELVMMAGFSRKINEAIPEFSHVKGLNRLDDRI